MGLPIFQVDAFASEPFRGNPAAVCLLDDARPEGWMQNVASEMNLSETAFVKKRDDGYDLRWFTPTIEVSLCGHATLATAHVLWESEGLEPDAPARFHPKSGVLVASRRDAGIEMSLPAISWKDADPPPRLLDALGVRPSYCGRTTDQGPGGADYLLVLESEEAVRGLAPDFQIMRAEVPVGAIVTARSSSEGQDFVSRYFASAWGIDEDPVTGAAHCTLVPFWTERLGRSRVTGFQASARGGFVEGTVDDGRVVLTGKAVTVFRGELCG
jgi:PhzF family phenazine biosynthesis protein